MTDAGDGIAGAPRTGVLVVCTGNVCRSPFVQLTLRERLRVMSGSRVPVDSAGTAALAGSGVDPTMGAELARAGIDVADFVSRQLAADQIDRAGLVVTASREHRTAVVRLRPDALARVFTLRQLERLLGALPTPVVGPLTPAEVASLCAGARGLVPSAGEDDDVPDPYGGEADAYARTIALAEPAVEALAIALGARS